MVHGELRGRPLSRRHFLQASAASVAALAGVACSDSTTDSEFHGDGRLSTVIAAPTSPLGPGVHSLGLGAPRDGRLFVPTGYAPSTPSALVVLLHGAGGSGQGIGTAFDGIAEAAGVVTLAPDSRYRTWDAVLEDFGPDVAFIDAALAWTVEHVNVDAARLAIAGFSDGASYALSLGLTNGGLFHRIIAFSPGFLYVRTARGKPPVYLAHGVDDPVLPIGQTSRTIKPALERAGYTVDYHEFEGGHVIKQTLAEQAFAWAAAP